MAMTGAMSAAVSGLKAHMDALNVVGNNVANVNTYGYKAGRVTFAESIYSTQSAGSGATATMGGTNPRQTGYGCSVGTIDLDMSSQSLALTGLATDCAIQGDGFFIVGPINDNILNTDQVKGDLSLSRVGNFEFRNGYLVDGRGNVVYGFVTVNQTAGTAGTTAAETPSTQLVPIKLPYKNSNGQTVYPGQQAGDKNVPPTIVAAGTATAADNECTGEFIEYENLSIDENGKIICTNSETGDPVVVGYIALAKVDNPNGLLHTDGPYYSAGDAAGDIALCTPNSSVTGPLNNVAPNTPGAPSLLSNTETNLMTGFLEDSGTDLATEFSNMIIYQRGYQANTRIVTVTDTMLEELVNMKR